MKKDELTNQTPADAKPVLCAGQFTCDKCQLKKKYSTGQTNTPLIQQLNIAVKVIGKVVTSPVRMI